METILIVDDDQDLRELIIDILQDEGYHALSAKDGEQAIEAIRRGGPDIVLLDMKLPDMRGMDVLREVKSIDGSVIVIMLTAYVDVKDAVTAMKLGAYDYLTKPFDNDELVLVLKKALQTRQLNHEIEHLKRQLAEKQTTAGQVIAESRRMQQILKQVGIVAPTRMTVIIEGESGTGKELIANMIHQASPRAMNQFIAIDCGAIPDTLMESELFGHERGAFTGADTQRKGKFEEADGGTLLLDEITNLSRSAQVKLLRVIQERKLRHIGGRKQISIDVRIIVASNVPLARAVKIGKFREDLFHRLNEFSIQLPPLRDRQEDIPLLCQHFLDEANREFGKTVKGLHAETMQHVLTYSWTGNVRELRNEVRKAVLLTESEYVLPDQLSSHIAKLPENMRFSASLDPNVSFEEVTQKFERDLIVKALQETGGNKTQTAKLLHINRKRLYRIMDRLGM